MIITICTYIFTKFYLFIYLEGRITERETHTHTQLPSAGSLYKWQQQPGLGQVEQGAPSRSSTCVSRAQVLGPSSTAFQTH